RIVAVALLARPDGRDAQAPFAVEVPGDGRLHGGLDRGELGVGQPVGLLVLEMLGQRQPAASQRRPYVPLVADVLALYVTLAEEAGPHHLLDRGVVAAAEIRTQAVH